MILGLFISTYLYPHIYPLPTHGRAIFKWVLSGRSLAYPYCRRLPWERTGKTLLFFACLGNRWEGVGTLVGNAPIPTDLPQNSFQCCCFLILCCCWERAGRGGTFFSSTFFNCCLNNNELINYKKTSVKIRRAFENLRGLFSLGPTR